MFLTSADTCEHSKGMCLEAENCHLPTYTASHSKIASESHAHICYQVFTQDAFQVLAVFWVFMLYWFWHFRGMHCLCLQLTELVQVGGEVSGWKNQLSSVTIPPQQPPGPFQTHWRWEAIFSSKTVKQSSPHGVKTQMKTIIYVFSTAYVIQHWAFNPNLDL
jgi:hypothetical protein